MNQYDAFNEYKASKMAYISAAIINAVMWIASAAVTIIGVLQGHVGFWAIMLIPALCSVRVKYKGGDENEDHQSQL